MPLDDQFFENLSLTSDKARGPAGAGPGNVAAPPAESPPPSSDGDGHEGNDEEPQPKTHRDMQRWALNELVSLTSQCAIQESEIQQRLQQSNDDAKQQHTRGHQDLERAYASYQEKIAQQYEDGKKQSESTCNQILVALKEKFEDTTIGAEEEHHRSLANLKNGYEQAMWLADSVLEAAEAKSAETLKKATELHATHNEQVQAKEAELQKILTRYNETPPAPTEPAAPTPQPNGSEDPATAFARHMQVVDGQLNKLGNLTIPNLMVGGKPYLLGILIFCLAVALPQIITATMVPNWLGMGIGAGVAIALLTFGAIVLNSKATKQVAAEYLPLRQSLDMAKRVNDDQINRTKDTAAMELSKARRQQKAEQSLAKDRLAPSKERADTKRDRALKNAQESYASKTVEAENQRNGELAALEQWKTDNVAKLKAWYDNKFAETDRQYADLQKQAGDTFTSERAALEKRWSDGLAHIQDPMHQGGGTHMDWGDPAWDKWKPPTKFPATVQFGKLEINLQTIIAEVAKDLPFTLPLPDTFNVPALLAFPRQASLLLETERDGRKDAVAAMQMVMTRLLTALPPGRVRFTLVDPVSLGQSFEGFMHLSDYDDALVTSKIWTDEDQINRNLANLTDHMETVIQKYLRNEFANIDDYNVQAGQLAEPYRFLVICDFPVNFSEEALRRLSSIATTGARCGVYTLVMRDTRVNVAAAHTHIEDLQAHSLKLAYENGKFAWRDEVFARFPLTLDAPPSDDQLTKLMRRVGERAKESKRVEVAFSTIAPKREEFWTLKTDADLQVAIGRCGATRLQTFRLGRGVAQHALIAGKTGSGKSTLLHALISNLAMWYSPEQIELYLIDFKKGVEFKTYAMHNLPHARAIAVESDREFGLSVLQRLDSELTRRGEMFRKVDVQDLASYRKTTGEPLPRTLLVIDEFQEFFTEDDKLSQDASLLLDRLVRQGRAFGIHVMLGSQTIGGSSGLSRSTIGQIAVRIALQTTDADSQMILGDGNSAARLLSRPGEAIYNDAGGLVEGNSPFQVAWLPDDQRDEYLDAVNDKLRTAGLKLSPPIIFEGNAPAEIQKNLALMEALRTGKYLLSAPAPLIWLGEPVAIKSPTSVMVRRQSGANIMIIGQSEDAALAILSQGMIGLAAQLPPSKASFYIFDGSPTDSASFGELPKVAQALPHKSKIVEYRAVGEAIHELAEEMAKRQESDATDAPAIFVLIFAMQRYRAIRKSEDSFSFSSSDEAKPADTGKEFADLIRDGPSVGIHFLAWIDTATALDRTLDRAALREFDHRIMFQMSAADSSNLIDSPAANKLGPNRGLSYSEEQGSMEKFRPYGRADANWLADVKKFLAAKKA